MSGWEDLLTDEQVEHFDRTIGSFFLKSTQKPIDRNHPHQCFQCKKPLKFSELLMFQMTCIGPYYNKKDYKIYKHLKKLWKNKYVQFYCCLCYSMTNTLEKWL